MAHIERKKELKLMYKELDVQAGIYQIKNTINNKVLLGSTRNLKTLNGVKFSLEQGSYANKELQEEWKQYGPGAFTFDVIEVLKKEEDMGYFNEKKELEMLLEKWLEQLQPYGDRGYNRCR